MRNRSAQSARAAPAGFTLLELIMVMVILAIAAAIIVPALRSFGIARSTDSAAEQVLTLAQFARTQAISEGRNYHLNFDTSTREVWLTALDSTTGNYLPPTNGFGDRYALPPGMTMSVDVLPQPNTLLVLPATAVLNTVTVTVPFGQPVSTNSNPVIEVGHTDGTYMEFQPSGRTDPGYVQLTDKLGKVIDLGCASATETMHVLSDAEVR